MRARLNLRSVTALSFLALLPAGSAAGGLNLSPGPPVAVSPPPIGVTELGVPGVIFPVEPAQAAPAQVPSALGGLPAGAFAAYATGTVLHTDPRLALDEEGDSLNLEFDLALSDAAHASAALPAMRDELGRETVPALPAGNSYSRGRGIKLPAVVEDLDLDFDPDPAEAKAPPTTGPVRKEASAELAFTRADSFTGEALARAVPTGCVIGDDLARGAAAANDTGVDLDGDFEDDDDAILSLEVDDPPPPRAVSQSTSRAALTPMPVTPGRFGVIAETRQTVAPVSFGIPGVPDTHFTLEIGGEYVLGAEADGTKGDLTFGPDGADDARPAARLFRDGDLIGGFGFGEVFPIEAGGETVGEVVVGADPRRIGGGPTDKPIISGTRVAAAADLAVVRFFQAKEQLRVGHMEVDVAVPVGGVSCPGIGLEKRSEPATVTAGKPFGFTITVSNPNDCVLDKVRVQDVATSTGGVAWNVSSTLPRSTIARDGTLTFDSLGPLKAGESRTIRINAEAATDSAPGSISNKATATGTCAKAPVAGASIAVTRVERAVVPPVPTPVELAPAMDDTSSRAAGAAAPPLPVSNRPAAAAERAPAADTDRRRSGGLLARTGRDLGVLLAVSLPLVGGGLALRRFRRRPGSVS